MNKLRLTGREIPKKEEQTFNPYPLKDREVVGSEAWIFTERLKFTDGVSNDSVSDWEKHLISAYHAHLAAVQNEEMAEMVARQIWMDDSGSDIGWPTGSGTRKDGVVWRIARQILSLIQPVLLARFEKEKADAVKDAIENTQARYNSHVRPRVVEKARKEERERIFKLFKDRANICPILPDDVEALKES